MPYLETVRELLEAKEGEHVQFKEAKHRFDFREAVKCCCALANNGGGKLVFGITDKRPRSVVGSAAFDQPERTRMGLIEKLKINVDFQIDIQRGWSSSGLRCEEPSNRFAGTIRWCSVDLRGRYAQAHAGGYAPQHL